MVMPCFSEIFGGFFNKDSYTESRDIWDKIQPHRGMEAMKMKAAICYYSRHLGNTLKVVQAMAREEPETELIDVTARQTVDLSGFDTVGLASGIYGFETSPAAAAFARQYLPEGKPVFIVYTYAAAKGTGAKQLIEIAREKGCEVLGEFSCRGCTTYGPFKLVGGIAKSRPNEADLDNARSFYRGILERCGK